MKAIIIWFLFCAFIWFSILAIEGLMSYLGDRKRRKMKEKQFELVMGKCPIEAGGNCPLKSQSEWIPVSERLPEEKINPMTNDFELVLCSTFLGTVRVCKYGQPMGYSHAHFWDWGEIMDEYITAWQPLPEPYVDARGQEHD